MSSIEGFAFEWLWSRIFAFRPKLSKEGQLLVATTGWRAHLFSLGFGSRKVVVDPHLRVVRLQIRKWWFYRTSKRIEFDWVEEILYGYNDMSAGASWSAHQAQDLFTVGLLLKNREEVTLFRYYGEGEFVNDGVWPDWFYWEDNLVSPYLRNTQEGESLMYCDLLSRMIGVPIGNPPP
ncbi:hypothetical protein [Fimbriimonas ginsengisoli]|uniref:Uncharacterized protein n=1 Tax=Fimbriimonas ginsengisoli Gsoil 348 TaxID=661478 RepID=A0A068NV22_FIMGI|nr:hypothetical protein [Fimbriimonas ginsengisoli]AIE85439.1 hypothetical protein OP10G_2071 [Fimbriimonas ginsengisoli Gsoil 348]